MKEITKERLMHIANDIQAIEMSEMTNAILAVKLEKNITDKVKRTNYINSLKQLIIKKDIKTATGLTIMRSNLSGDVLLKRQAVSIPYIVQKK